MKMRLPCPGIFCCGGDFFQTVNAPRAEQQFRALRAKRRGRRRAKTRLDAPVMRTHLSFSGDFMK